jgi:hypothetical protein
MLHICTRHVHVLAGQTSKDLLEPWLMPDGSIKGLPHEAVEHARMWAQHYAALDTDALSTKVKTLVESMRRDWERATNKAS